jgi:hypothetical protein
MHNATICSVRLSLAKLDGPVFETRGSTISRIVDESSKIMTTDPDDWRTPLVHYLENPGHIAKRKVQCQALKYVMLYNTLYRRTIDGLLLKCLGSDQSKIAMGEVHEGICCTHQSTHKMKWLLRCAGFYWQTMINDCFRYYKCFIKVRRCAIDSCCYVTPYNQAMAISWLGFRLRCPNPSCFIQRPSFCVSRYGLLHQLGGSYPVKEHDA